MHALHGFCLYPKFVLYFFLLINLICRISGTSKFILPDIFLVLNVGKFSGMIHWRTIKQLIPTPNNPSIRY